MMKYKVVILLCFFTFGNMVFSQSGIVQNRASFKPSAIQSTNMVFKDKNYSTFYSEDTLNAALTEIQNKIQLSPHNYSLYVSLVDLYTRTKQYEKAYKELVSLYKLSTEDKLSFNTKEELINLLNRLKNNVRYEKNKSPIYMDMAILSLIADDKEGAQDYIGYASKGLVNEDMLKDAFSLIFNPQESSQKALEVCNNIISRNPEDVQIRKLKAQYLTQINNKDAAIEEYSVISALSPNDKDVKYNLYKLLCDKNYSQKDIINKMYPENTKNYEKIYADMAEILLKNNNLPEAKNYALMLTEKFPKNEVGYMVLADICQKEGDLKSAYEALSKLRDTADSSDAVAKYNVMLAKLSDEPVREANSLIATGLYQQALDVLDSANPENLYVILSQVRANYMLSNRQKTMELLNKAMSLYPDDSDVYCAFGWVYLQEKEIDTARKYADGSLKLNPENKSAQELLDMVNKAEADTYKSKIVALYEAQNYVQADKLIDEAVKINKKDANLYFYKALIYIAQNNYAAATAPLYMAIELDKTYAPSYFYLALSFDNLSEKKNALENYQKYLTLLKPDDYSETERKEYASSRISQLNNL